MSLRAFGKSAIVYSVGTIFARLAMFILIPIYTHYLSLDDFGLLSILMLTIQLLGTIIDFGLLKSLMRFIPEYSEQNKEGELVGSALVLNCISGLLIILLSIIFLPTLFQNLLGIKNSFLVLVFTSLAAFTQSISLNFISYFRAQNDAKWYTILSILTSVFTLVLGFSFIVLLSLGIEGALSAYIISYSIIIIVTLIRLSSKLKISCSIYTLKILVKYGFPLIFARSGDLIVGLVSVYFLSYFVNISAVGIYNLASKITLIMGLILVLPFQLALEPYVFRNITDTNLKTNLSKIATYLLLSFFIFSFILIYISPFLVGILAPPEYFEAYYLIIFLLPISLYQGFSYFSESLLHINKKSSTTGIIIGTMTLISIGFSYFLIKHFGVVGILLTTNIHYLFIAVLLFYFGKREFYIKLEKIRMFSLFISFSVAIVIILLMFRINLFLYYILSPLVFIMLILALFKFHFFDIKEKTNMRSLLNRLSIRWRKVNT